MAEDGATGDKEFEKRAVRLLANRIQQLRIAKGYDSYEKFANDHNIHRAQFGRYEKGTNLQFASLVRVIQAMGVSFEEFFSEGFEDLGNISGNRS